MSHPDDRAVICLQYAPDVQAKDANGLTALELACQQGSIEYVKPLLNQMMVAQNMTVGDMQRSSCQSCHSYQQRKLMHLEAFMKRLNCKSMIF